MKRGTRVRYELKKDGTYESIQTFMGNEATLLKTAILPESKTACVLMLKDDDRKVLTVLTYDTFNNAKKQLKEALKAYGVVFYEEVRKREPKNEQDVVMED